MEYHRLPVGQEDFRWHNFLTIIAVSRFLLLLSLIVYFAVMFNEWADNQSRIYLDMGHRELGRLTIAILMALGAFEWMRPFMEELSNYRRLIGGMPPLRLPPPPLFRERSNYRRLIVVLGWILLSWITVTIAFFYVPSFSDWATEILGGDKTVKKYILYGFVWILAPLGALTTIMWAAARVGRFIREDDINAIGSDNG